MFLRLANYYEWKGQMDTAEQQLMVCEKVIEALSGDMALGNGTRTFFKSSFYEYYGKKVLEKLHSWKKDGRTPQIEQDA